MSFQDSSLTPPTMVDDLIDVNMLLDDIGEEETTDGGNLEIGEMLDLEVPVPTDTTTQTNPTDNTTTTQTPLKILQTLMVQPLKLTKLRVLRVREMLLVELLVPKNLLFILKWCLLKVLMALRSGSADGVVSFTHMIQSGKVHLMVRNT